MHEDPSISEDEVGEGGILAEVVKLVLAFRNAYSEVPQRLWSI